MLAEAFHCLSSLEPLRSYRYIGLGSTYFGDFTLFHKSLGITDMLSMEKDAGNSARFTFNKPFSCIKLDFRPASQVLPALSWNRRTILWLDYDGKMNFEVLTDMGYFLANAPPTSVLVVTVNAQPDNPPEERLARLKNRLQEKVPRDVQDKNLSGWGTAGVYWRVMNDEICSIINSRNGELETDRKILYKQLFHFQYEDDAKMLTVGGLLYEKRQSPAVGKCGFEHLPFFRSGSEAYRLEVPNLTLREIRHLDSQLPINRIGGLQGHAIPRRDLTTYSRIYRYFPSFVEAEL